MTPALLTSMCRGVELNCWAKLRTEPRSMRSRRATVTRSPSRLSLISAPTRTPASGLRTARVTSAPAEASGRAVSMPMRDEPPVTIARLSRRSVPATTSATVDLAVKGLVMRPWVMVVHATRARETPRSAAARLEGLGRPRAGCRAHHSPARRLPMPAGSPSWARRGARAANRPPKPAPTIATRWRGDSAAGAGARVIGAYRVAADERPSVGRGEGFGDEFAPWRSSARCGFAYRRRTYPHPASPLAARENPRSAAM